MATATIDDRYRITIPFEAREGLKPGDVLFMRREAGPGGPLLHAAKAINPFAALEADDPGERPDLDRGVGR